MTQQRSPRRFRTIRHVAALAVLAIGGTVLASSPASAANADGVTVGCERDPNLASSILGVIKPSLLSVRLPTVTAANATTFVRYRVGGTPQTIITPSYRSTTGNLLPNPYGTPYASGTREWYNTHTGQKSRMAVELAEVRPGTVIWVVQEKYVWQNGRWSSATVDIVGAGAC